MFRTPVTVGPIQGASANAFVTSVTPTSGTALTLTGTQPDVPRKILLTYGSEGSARTMVIMGTNAFGNLIGEVLNIPSGSSGTVATVYDYKTITQALPLGGGWTAAVTLGTNGVASSPWLLPSVMMTPFNVSIGVIVTGTANYTVEYTYDGIDTFVPQVGIPNPGVLTPPNIFKHATLVSLTASTDGVITSPVHAFRLTLNSGSGSVTGTFLQTGVIQG